MYSHPLFFLQAYIVTESTEMKRSGIEVAFRHRTASRAMHN